MLREYNKSFMEQKVIAQLVCKFSKYILKKYNKKIAWAKTKSDFSIALITT